METAKIRLRANKAAWVAVGWIAGLAIGLGAMWQRYNIAYAEKIERAEVARALAVSERQKALADTELAVAEQKLAIAQLEDLSAVRLATNALVESDTFGFIVVSRMGIIKYWNPALEKLTEKKSAEMVGKNISAIMTPDSAASHVPKFTAMMSDPSQWGKIVFVERCQLLHADPDRELPVVRVRAGIFDTPIGPLGVAQLTLPQSVVQVPGNAPPAETDQL